MSTQSGGGTKPGVKRPESPKGKGSMQLKEHWDGQGSVFGEEDGRFDYHGSAPAGTQVKGKPSGEGGTADIEDQLQVRREVKLQALGKQIVSNLYMLVRNVKIHAPDNQVFLKPIEQLRESMNAVIASDKQLNLQAVGTAIYLNNAQLKFDFSALENVQYLTREFEQRDIGGFSTKRPVTSQEIRDFLFIFTAEYKGKVSEDGAEGREMPSLKLARFRMVKEILDKLQAEPDLNEQIDRKKYLMTVYSRAVFFMKKYFEKVANGDFSIPFAKAGRIIQDLVDLCHDEKTHFLGVTTARSDAEYLPYHSVNTALLTIVFGSELKLDKRQLHELGMGALFSGIGLVGVPEDTLSKAGSLSQSERQMIDTYPLRSAKKILFARGLDKTTMLRIVAAYESKVDFAVPQKGEDGEVELVMPKMGLGMYGKIIAICDTYDALTSRRPFREAYGPEIALALMSSELKYKFDPVLLRVFMKVMAIQPIKILDKSESTLRIG
jgi:HD-GYP domain-containing protein (c-di-GMP phosphodiesterase class II)